MPLDAYPNIVRWIDGLLRIPAWAQPWPARREALELAAS
jgi:glutathione S-transferase